MLQSLLSDKSRQFLSEVLRAPCKLMGIRELTTNPFYPEATNAYYPKGNDITEGMNHTTA